ncbi:MAG: hypothetical protein E7218_04960 [Anaerofustis stercorihominis]|nr:hypothetical protein [Anaerofustis stercorihominis]
MKSIKRNGIGAYITLIIYMILGAAIGATVAVNMDIYELYSHGPLIVIAGFLVFFYGSVILQVIIHEGGHLVFGLLSGYKFLSFRIFDYILVKHDKKIVLKKHKLPGTAGQCLMYPPEYDDGKYPYVLYNMGGGLMNIIFSTVILIAASLVKKGILWIFLIFWAYCGYSTAAANLIPMRMGGLANDGKNIIYIGKDAASKRAFWVQLYINAMTTEGKRCSEIDESLYDTDGCDVNNPINQSVYIMNVNRLLDMREYEKALELCEELLDSGAFVNITRYSLEVERMCLMMLTGKYESAADFGYPYDKKLKQYIKKTAILPQTRRFEYMYAYIIEDDTQKAEKIKEKWEYSLSVCANVGEKALENQLFSDISKFIVHN